MGIKEWYENYISINLKDYPNIGFDLEITKILFCLLIGAIISTVLINYLRTGMNAVIKALIRKEATNEGSAKTLDELGLNSLSARYAVTRNSRLSKVIKYVGMKEYTYEEYSALIKTKGYREEKPDLKTAKFYIPEENKQEARLIYERHETSLISTLLFCVLLLAVFACISLALPEILTLIDNSLAK